MKAGERFARLGKENDSGNRAVEPVDRLEKDITGLVIALLNPELSQLLQTLLAVCRLRQKPVWFEQSEYVVVFEKDLHSLCLTASKRRSVVADATLSESAMPNIGMRTR